MLRYSSSTQMRYRPHLRSSSPARSTRCWSADLAWSFDGDAFEGVLAIGEVRVGDRSVHDDLVNTSFDMAAGEVEERAYGLKRSTAVGVKPVPTAPIPSWGSRVLCATSRPASIGSVS